MIFSSGHLCYYLTILLFTSLVDHPDFGQPAAMQPRIADRKIEVLVFLDVDCPVSQLYTRELDQLRRRYGRENVVFRAVYPSSDSNRRSIRDFQRSYRFSIRGEADPAQRLAVRYDARVTPEVIIVRADSVVYRGAVDDRYIDLGRMRRPPYRPYVAQALDALLSGQPVPIPQTKAVGCLINRL